MAGCSRAIVSFVWDLPPETGGSGLLVSCYKVPETADSKARVLQAQLVTQQSIYELQGLDGGLNGVNPILRDGTILSTNSEGLRYGNYLYTGGTGVGVRSACDLDTGKVYFFSPGRCIYELPAGLRGTVGYECRSLVSCHEGVTDMVCDDGTLLLTVRGQLQRVTLPRPGYGLMNGILDAPKPVQGLHLLSLALYHADACLYAATASAVYKIVGRRAELVAGAEAATGVDDGHIDTARFSSITSMVVDADGFLFLSDMASSGMLLRRVDPLTGQVTTLPIGAPSGFGAGEPCRLTILPHGWLSAMEMGGSRALLMQLGIQPSLPGDAPTRQQASRRQQHHRARLLERLSALLPSDGGPGAASDVTILVGGVSFPAHRAILSANSQYFRSSMAGEAWDAGSRQVHLNVADPDAFRHVLRYMYGACVDFPPGLLQPIAELADRLLLPEACAEAQRQLLGAVCAESAPDMLLWAERRGFCWLVSQLTAWYLAHEAEVLEAAGEGLKRLMAASPELMLELCRAARGAAAKRPREE